MVSEFETNASFLCDTTTVATALHKMYSLHRSPDVSLTIYQISHFIILRSKYSYTSANEDFLAVFFWTRLTNMDSTNECFSGCAR
jgi:hypothetical protein